MTSTSPTDLRSDSAFHGQHITRPQTSFRIAAPETVAAILDLLSQKETVITVADDSVVILFEIEDPPKGSFYKQDGFTTVELLAIIVTIALIAILLFPHLPRMSA